MKAYGIKHQKSKLGIHDSDRCGCTLCNNKDWSVVKGRERLNEKLIVAENELDIPSETEEFDAWLENLLYEEQFWFYE